MEYTYAEIYIGLNNTNQCRKKHGNYYWLKSRLLIWTLLVFNGLTIMCLYPLQQCDKLSYIPDLSLIPGYTQPVKTTSQSFSSDWPMKRCYQPGFSDELATSDPNCPKDEVMRDPPWKGKPFIDNFKFHMEPNCDEYDYKHLVVYFYSRAYNFKERRKVRLQFMDYLGNVVGHKLKIIFVIGVPEGFGLKQNGEAFLNIESKVFKDILRPDIAEKYHELAFKGFAVLQWLQKCSKHSTFIMKMDDDFMLNMTAVYNLLRSIPCEYSHSLVCYEPILQNRVFRLPGKSYVSKGDYEPSYYPLGCHGHGYIMTRQVASRYYKIGKILGKVPKIDDMYFSAVLRRKACVSVSEIDLEKGIVHNIRFSG